MIYGGSYLSAMPEHEKPLTPFVPRDVFEWEDLVLSYGCGFASYDVRLDQDVAISKKSGLLLASTLEKFRMPRYMAARVHDKSSLVRIGLTVQNTFIDPGWCGFLTLELVYHGDGTLLLVRGMPIAQVVFEQVCMARSYSGKYQNQEQGPQEAR